MVKDRPAWNRLRLLTASSVHKAFSSTTSQYFSLCFSPTLVPRAFHRPIFDRLQNAKKEEGKAWSSLSSEWRHIFPGRQRGEGAQIERTSLRYFHIISVPSTGVSTGRKAKKTTILGSRQRTCVRNVFFQSGTQFSHSDYLGRHSWHSRDKMDQAFPSVFAYCKQSKAGRREGLGMRLLFTILAHLNCEHLLSLKQYQGPKFSTSATVGGYQSVSHLGLYQQIPIQSSTERVRNQFSWTLAELGL